MKKLFSLLSVLVIVSCTNPSMEDGFTALEKSLAELGEAIEALNIPQMQSDLEQMNSTAAQMLQDVESMQGNWDEAMEQFSILRSLLNSMVEDSANWATSEDMQELLINVEKFNHGVETLVLAADFDHDGVVNALDKCPDTPILQIRNVNALGCAPGETINTGN